MCIVRQQRFSPHTYVQTYIRPLLRFHIHCQAVGQGREERDMADAGSNDDKSLSASASALDDKSAPAPAPASPVKQQSAPAPAPASPVKQQSAPAPAPAPPVKQQSAPASDDKSAPAPASPVKQQTDIQKKYGGLTPKKHLISLNHERTYFDSADWALCKQSPNSTPERTAEIESRKPKLKRTPRGPLSPRRPSCSCRIDLD